MTDEVIALHPDDFTEIAQHMRDARTVVREGTGVTRKPQTYPAPIRVIALTDREYDSTTSERLPIFVYDRNKVVYTVEQVGSALSGYVALTVNGQRFVLECRVQSLSEVEDGVPGIRATVLPGLWEFDFGSPDSISGRDAAVSVAQITEDENLELCELFDDLETAIFSGATIVRQEYWVTVPLAAPEEEDTLPIVHREVTDSTPYQTSSVPAGAIGTAIWNWDAGYTAISWQCRTFSHAVEDEE